MPYHVPETPLHTLANSRHLGVELLLLWRDSAHPWAVQMPSLRIGRIPIEAKRHAVEVEVSFNIFQHSAGSQEVGIMTPSRLRAIQVGNQPIRSHNGLKFQPMLPLVAIVHLLLVVCWPAYAADSPINETPAVL